MGKGWAGSGLFLLCLRMEYQQVRSGLTEVELTGLRARAGELRAEGAELAALQGIEARHWPLVRSVVAEVHDVDGRLDAMRDLLSRNGLTRCVTEKEAGFEHTPMINLYATRP